MWNFLCFISDSSPETLEAHKIKTAFFTYPTLMEICRRLVTHYFLLTNEELTMWEEDPESFSKKCVVDLVAVYFNIGIRVLYLHRLYKLLTAILSVLFSVSRDCFHNKRFLSSLVHTYLNIKLIWTIVDNNNANIFFFSLWNNSCRRDRRRFLEVQSQSKCFSLTENQYFWMHFLIVF